MIRQIGCWIGLALLVGACSGCGVLYTVMKSESKLDRLAVPMTKAEVIAQVGRPDRVLRDDGQMLVWEYSLTARKQWLYELALCPLSMWVGGCLFYPFTNIVADHQREYPHHIVLVNEELCAWGTPTAILQRRRACASSGTAALGVGGMRGRPEPVVTGLGPINRETIDRYRTMAVMAFEDAPGAEESGSRVAGMVTTLLLDLDINMVERTELDEVFKEQVIQLKHADDAEVLNVGKLVGAQAILVAKCSNGGDSMESRTAACRWALESSMSRAVWCYSMGRDTVLTPRLMILRAWPAPLYSAFSLGSDRKPGCLGPDGSVSIGTYKNQRRHDTTSCGKFEAAYRQRKRALR